MEMDENIFENKKGQIGVGIENRHEGTDRGRKKGNDSGGNVRRRKEKERRGLRVWEPTSLIWVNHRFPHVTD